MCSPEALVSIFLATLRPDLRASWAEDSQLAERLNSVHQAAKTARSGIFVSLDAFVEHLARHVGCQFSPAALDQMHGHDLYLAVACLSNVAGAIGTFEKECMSSVSRTLAHRNLSPDFMEELKQELRASLLVGSMEKPAKLASYAGQGPLKN